MFQKNKIYLKGWFAMIILRTTAVDKRSISHSKIIVNQMEGNKMKKYEITYMENGEYKSLIIYGKENYQVFLDENINYIDIISVAEI